MDGGGLSKEVRNFIIRCVMPARCENDRKVTQGAIYQFFDKNVLS